MESLMNFLAANYIWFFVLAGILCLALVGFIIDSKRKKKDEFKGESVEETPAKTEPEIIGETINLGADAAFDTITEPSINSLNETVANNQNPTLDNEMQINDIPMNLEKDNLNEVPINPELENINQEPVSAPAFGESISFDGSVTQTKQEDNNIEMF